MKAEIQHAAENGIAWAAQHRVPGAWKMAEVLGSLTDRSLCYGESIAETVDGTVRSSWCRWQPKSSRYKSS
jgi:hypothetical protein